MDPCYQGTYLSTTHTTVVLNEVFGERFIYMETGTERFS